MRGVAYALIAAAVLALGALTSVPASANGYHPARSYHHHHHHYRSASIYHRPRHYPSRYHVSYERRHHVAPYWHHTVRRTARYLRPSYRSYHDDSYESARPLYRPAYYHRPVYYAPSYYTVGYGSGCCATYASGCCGGSGYGGYGYGGYYPRVAVLPVVSGYGYGGYGYGGGCAVAQYGYGWPRAC